MSTVLRDCPVCPHPIDVTDGVIERHDRTGVYDPCPAGGLPLRQVVADRAVHDLLDAVWTVRDRRLARDEPPPARILMHGAARGVINKSTIWYDRGLLTGVLSPPLPEQMVSGELGRAFDIPIYADDGLPPGMWRVADDDGATLRFGFVPQETS